MNNKYRLTDEIVEYFGHTLHRIEALIDLPNVVKGDKGGWIEYEHNLEQDGNAWVYNNAKVFGNAIVRGDVRVFADAMVYGDAQVYGDAMVYGNAQVYGDAMVYDNAQVHGDARVYGDAQVYGDAWLRGNACVGRDCDLITIGPIGSRNGITSFMRTEQDGIYVACGCFSGSINEFEERVRQVHGDNKHGIAYQSAIEMVRNIISDVEGNDE